MTRIGYLLLAVLVADLAADPLLAQAPATPPPASSLTPEKIAAKEKAVEDHAKKRAECKKLAKEAGLGLMARTKFVRECIAAK